jgi:hypothetical protein
MDQGSDVKRAEENVKALQTQLDALNAEFISEQSAMGLGAGASTEAFETINVKPKKTDISIQLVALVWAPYQTTPSGLFPLYT